MAFTSYEAARHGIRRARRLLYGAAKTSKHEQLSPATGQMETMPEQLPSTTRADMRRLSVVMAVAALDTYMHRLIVERAYKHDELPGGLARLDVGFEDLLRQTDATAASARAKPHKPKPRVGLKKLLRDRLLRETFQSYDAVARALSMAGHSKAWPEIGKEMPTPREPKEIKARLNAIVMRRNQIVHEGDYERLERPRNSRRNPMTQKQAERDIDFLDEVIEAIHAVVS